MRRRALIGLAVFVGGYAALTVVACIVGRAMVFPGAGPPREPVLPGSTLERIAAPDGSTVFALYVPGPPGAPTVVYLHGNARQLADLVDVAADMRATGVGVYVVEYPGYGLAAS